MSGSVVAAVDVGGTSIKAALVDRAGHEVVALTAPTPAGLDEPDRLVAEVRDVVGRLEALARDRATGATVVAWGVVVPGLVDDAAGVARYSANLGWRDEAVVSRLRTRLAVPVALGHDVRAGLVAESRFGAAQGRENVLFMPVGTGIAGALMLDGRVVLAHGRSGELGHVIIDPNGPTCRCGARGCLEAVASASALETAYAARSGERVTAEVVASRVAREEPDAVTVWDDAVAALVRAVTMTVTLTGVDLVLVGGGLARSGEVLLGPLRQGVRDSLTFQRVPTIAPASLEDRAGCIGAACLAWDLS